MIDGTIDFLARGVALATIGFDNRYTVLNSILFASKNPPTMMCYKTLSGKVINLEHIYLNLSKATSCMMVLRTLMLLNAGTFYSCAQKSIPKISKNNLRGKLNKL